MSKKLVCMMAAVVLCAGLARADLVGHWSLDEGTGTVAHDGTSNGHDGELLGNPQWVEAYYKMGLEFAGNPDKVDIPYSEQLNPETAFSLSLWAYPDPGGSGHRSPITSRDDYPQRGYIIYIEPGNTWQYWIGVGSWNNTQGPAANLGEWTHVGATYDNGAKKFYINGDLVAEGSGTITPNTQQVLRIGGGATEGTGNFFWVGKVDDVAVFDHALTDAEIKSAMKGLAPPELAANPSPEDAVIDVPRDVTLAWEAGDFAVKHDVYLGTSLEDVNSASVADPLGVLVAQGQADTTYAAGILDFGQTYYWRVDEVNGAPDNTVFKGDVWSFSVEPYSIPVEAITATASSANAANMGPENTIGGIGLNELDQHSTEATDMWLSGMGDPTPSIQYEFDQAYKLHELWVWNSNQLIESFVGLGAKDVVIEYSVDGVEWMTLENVPPFAQATGSPTYTANTVVDFAGVLAKYVKITISAGFGMLPQYGLSEVRFYYIPTFAREPQPADGAVTQGADVMLSWRAGREAAEHEIYLSTDPGNLELIATVTDHAYTANGLLFDTAYYWQVVEVNDSETPTAYASPVWGFNTPTHGTVDNMDGYDDDCNRIFFAWADGLGHNGGEEIEDCDVPPSNGNGGGAIVGNDTAPFAERTIVYVGTQSLPFNYDNAFGPSEARLTLDGQDWTASGVQSLSLMFYGTAGNTGQLYVKINNTKVSYADDAANIARAEWQAWVIDLSQVGGNLQNVTSLTIGVDGANASGMLYIDEIGLYPQAAEYITPVDPGNANLAGHWSFDEGAGTVAADASGNGNDGTLVNAGWQAGQLGSAVIFDGMTGYVDIPAAAWNSIEQQATVAVWLYIDSSISQNPVTFAAYQDAANNNARVFSTHVLWGNTLYLDTGGTTAYDRISKAASTADYADAWIHWAFTKNADTGEQKIYRNGVLWHSGTGLTRPMTGVTAFTLGAKPNQTEYWNGSMDDFRLYNTELSQEEILWVAGRTSPVVNPF